MKLALNFACFAAIVAANPADARVAADATTATTPADSSSVPAFMRRTTEESMKDCRDVNKSYGSGQLIDQANGLASNEITVVGSATCTFSCDSASSLAIYMGFNDPGSVSKDQNDARNENANCGDKLTAWNFRDGGFATIVVATDYVNLRVFCDCTTSDEITNGGGCFSGSDTVQVLEKGQVDMSDLKVGDYVLAEANKYEQVYSFGHAHSTAQVEFVELQTGNGESLTMTPNHLIQTDKGTVRADAVEVNDEVYTLSGPTPVTRKSILDKQGLYMPLTPSGKIVVNNVQASAYISMSDYAPIQQHSLLKGWLSEDMLVHLWMGPYRMYCLGVASSLDVCARYVPEDKDGAAGVLPYLRLGWSIAEAALQQPLLVQIMMGVPVMTTLLMVNALETATGPSMGPLVMLIAVALFIQRRRRVQDGKKGKVL